MSKTTGEIILRFRPVPDGVDHLGRDPMYRTKLLLKRALRCFGLRCVQIDQAKPASGNVFFAPADIPKSGDPESGRSGERDRQPGRKHDNHANRAKTIEGRP